MLPNMGNRRGPGAVGNESKSTWLSTGDDDGGGIFLPSISIPASDSFRIDDDDAADACRIIPPLAALGVAMLMQL